MSVEKAGCAVLVSVWSEGLRYVYTADTNLTIAGVTWRSLVMWSFTVRSGGEARVRERMDCSSRVCRERPKSCNSWASMVRRCREWWCRCGQWKTAWRRSPTGARGSRGWDQRGQERSKYVTKAGVPWPERW